MHSVSRAIDTLTPSSPTPTQYTLSVSRIDRWSIYHRLQELTIPCWCLEDGSLQVEIQDVCSALLVRSVVQQFVASRSELVQWLKSCWHIITE